MISEPDESLDSPRIPVPQGRVLGGGSSVYVMLYIRGTMAFGPKAMVAEAGTSGLFCPSPEGRKHR